MTASCARCHMRLPAFWRGTDGVRVFTLCVDCHERVLGDGIRRMVMSGDACVCNGDAALPQECFIQEDRES